MANLTFPIRVNFPDEGQKELPEWWFCAGGKRKGEDV